jgi:hypothetical protein
MFASVNVKPPADLELRSREKKFSCFNEASRCLHFTVPEADS